MHSTPHATYRIQLNGKFRFPDAEGIVPYLHTLGISHLYPSPCLRARAGSTHGYDITNHAELNPELGTKENFDRLVAALKTNGMGQIFDTVPNHMGILGANPWWLDILENGPSSRYAHYFDIDWYSAIKPELHETVLLPILGSSYGDALEAGEIQLVCHEGQFSARYFDNSFPIAACTIDKILSHRSAELESLLGPNSDATLEYQSIDTAVRHLPRRNDA